MVGKSFFMGQKFMPKWRKNPKNKKGAKLLFVMVRVTGQIEQTLQAKSQVCLDGHSPSFALQNVKRCLLPTPAVLGRFFELITQTNNKRTAKTVPLLLVRVTGLEPARR